MRIKKSISSSKTRLFCNNQHVVEVTIKRVGDFCSPLLFALTLTPLSVLLRKVNVHFLLRNNGPRRNHFLFNDSFKLFAKSEPEIERAVETAAKI